MKMKNGFGIALVAAMALSLCLASTSHAVFLDSLADVFQADFTAAGGTLPVTKVGLGTPNGGAITFYANGDAQGTSSLVAGPSTPGGGGTGWDDLSGPISYNRGGAFGVGPGAGDAIVGHGGDGATLTPAEHKIDYTVPVTGLYNLTGMLQQPFEPTRSMRFQLFNNDFTGAGASLLDFETAGVQTAPGITSTASGVNLTAGDVLTLIVDGSGASGTQVGTWVGLNLIVEQIPEPASMALAGLGLSSILVMSRRRR